MVQRLARIRKQTEGSEAKRVKRDDVVAEQWEMRRSTYCCFELLPWLHQ